MPGDIVVKPVIITRADGSTETVYIEDDDDDNQTEVFHRNVSLLYYGVSIVAILLTGYLTYLQIKRSRT